MPVVSYGLYFFTEHGIYSVLMGGNPEAVVHGLCQGWLCKYLCKFGLADQGPARRSTGKLTATLICRHNLVWE